MDRAFFSQRVVSLAALLTAMFLWGSSFVAMKFAMASLHPLLVVWARMVIASICFLPFLPSFSRLAIGRRHLLPLLALGICEPCLYFLFETAALKLTSASQASLITTMLPLLVAVAAGIFLGERISARIVTGLLVAAAGAVWLSLAAAVSEHAPNPVLGNFLEFLAMVTATGYIILLKKLSADLPPLFLTAMQSFIGAVFFLLVVLIMGTPIPTNLDMEVIFSLVYLGVFVSVGAYSLYNFGVSRVPANQAAAFINLIPLWAVLLGVLLLGERFTLWQFAAGALIFIGVMITQDLKSASRG
jgi:drug/metabolite transporter (DMT)-like permease